MLTYRAGDADRPRGHALLYFRDADDPSAVWATYLVVAPIAMDIGKYIPAAFAGNLAELAGQGGIAAYPLPPIPEKVEGGLPALERLAELRADDLLDGGTLRVAEPWQAVPAVTQIGQEYARAWEERSKQAATALDQPEPAAPASAVDVDDILLQVMPDREKIGRLARSAGSLRYAVEGGDAALLQDTVREMERVARYLADKYRARDLIQAAQRRDARGGKLAQLYIERCYRLVDEDYAALPAIEQEIQALNEPA